MRTGRRQQLLAKETGLGGASTEIPSGTSDAVGTKGYIVRDGNTQAGAPLVRCDEDQDPLNFFTLANWLGRLLPMSMVWKEDLFWRPPKLLLCAELKTQHGCSLRPSTMHARFLLSVPEYFQFLAHILQNTFECMMTEY